MTDFISNEPGPAAPFGLLNELLSLRVELAEAKAEIKKLKEWRIEPCTSHSDTNCSTLKIG